ncbi:MULTISPECIES: MaoC/PaaZ C-terminal domain-containing protein [unclassified Oceanobacter]|uniref:MaoC/PaaZ C-terminal domain-containing protein n=1 Tax=unclassified Oceanobacter TaxID=2620260 RepID=UPI002733B44A|nr:MULTISPECIES: MaoC/PaaZ C-terminal domain-containing protein [unclassified Oceanobacter]MDP2504429.1 MaoC/PaaZ C-terminal domain-containing protein [Oceanobacter sp. 3_MG-2023]MDP2548325.1 MaoC/PaaZ C-terminal domain-containing protein [Oceanobacter sp. 4_MG-2023]
METITNRTYEELNIGDSCQRTHTIDERDLQLFAIVSGDHNPLHLDPVFAATTQFKGQIAHGMYSGALISAALGMELPGPGTIYLGQNAQFKRPIMIGDTVTVTLTVKEKRDRNQVVIDTTITNQNDKAVVTGEAFILAPSEKMTIDMPDLPEITITQPAGK